MILVPTISLRRVDHYYAVCSYVWRDVNFVYTMFVCIATTSARFHGFEDHSSNWNLKCQASCALDHFFLPTHVLINHNDLHRLILMGPNRLP
jgi:hypothetical protein